MNSPAFDAPKSPESYEDFGISSLDSNSIQKEASAQVLSEILADFGKESEVEEVKETKEAEDKTASQKAAQEEKVKEEDKKEEEEKEEKKEKKEEKKEEEAKDEGKGAEDLALKKSLEKDAVAYFDLGKWMAIDKVAEELNEVGEIDAKTLAAINLHVAGLTDSLVV